MKFLRYLILICVAVIGGTLFAQSQRELGELMRERNEYYFFLSVEQSAEIQAISNLCSIDGTDGHIVVCYANQQQYDKLLQAGYQPDLQTPPSLREEARMWDGNRATYEWDSYPTYSQYQSMMEAFPVSAVDGRTCTLMTLGTLSSGRKIMGVRINNGDPEGKPKFLYSSTIHGDETTGWILMLRLIDELCTSMDSRIVNLVNNLDIFIFPNANPDGTYYGGDNNVTGARRYNANGVDMNRNYPDPHGSEHPDNEEYQTETQWFMQLAENYSFVMAANYHGGSEVMNYPWDNTYTLHADDAWWQYVSREYADLAQSVNSSYMTDENNGITNGAQWYTIGGGRQDYMNGYRQCREITIECSTVKNPSASELPSFWNYNHNAMLTYMEECLNGVHGFVYDAATNQPLEGVTVKVENHDDNYSFVSTHEAGDFHRPIKGGSYTFVFHKTGYYPQSVDVTITDGHRVDLEPIYLEFGYEEPEEPEAITMQNGTVETCNALFYDSGGQNGGYGNNLTYTMTFNPSSEGAKISVNFSEFNTESNYDFLYVYDGTSTSATLIGQYSGTTSPGAFTATNSAGALTFKFTSDSYVNASGWVATVSCVYPERTIIALVEPVEGGTVDGAGTYTQNEICTLTATANEGYTFVNWTEDGEEVSTDASYSFEVTGDRSLVANFEEDNAMVTQSTTFGAGWNWWTPNVGLDGAELLSQLKSALGNNGVKIMAQDGRSVTNSSHGWGAGSLTSLEVGSMYMVQTTSSCNFTVEGPAVNPASQNVTVKPGNNWIGFFGTEAVPVNTALSNLTATTGDAITAQDGSSATYTSHGWGGTLKNLVPGEAYIYNSKASSDKTFIFQTVK